MRHIKTAIAALILGPLAWVLLAAGQGRSLRVFEDAQENGGVLDPHALLKPLLVLAAAGLLLGLLATVRISPLGSVLIGLGYSASYAGLLFSPARVLDLLSHKLSVAGYQIDVLTPVRTGTTLLLGSLLLVGVASVQRWRRWPQSDADEPTADVPANTIPPVSERDRPLDADGFRPLDADRLGSPKQAENPTKPGIADEPEPAMAHGPRWIDSLRSDSTGEPWQSDATRWQTPPQRKGYPN
ncbi:hypothetical protein GA0074692_2697 [Micromonospora pallida]|uniref:Tryptophan-associated transmembrane protein (Trp_oprn_chp) n=1 Tax=Micromonospora pallida TaxID=145854 RepID=A0A1C6SIB4_9ACTN|nr:hypothetical protein [Micromonospora pallida]SCL29284.1 hypothetical protein GA0074692_2697 [Micromonospora pallida]